MRDYVFILINQDLWFGGANLSLICIVSCYFDVYNLNFTMTPIFIESITPTSIFDFSHFGSHLCPTQDTQGFTYRPPPTPVQSSPRSPTECQFDSSMAHGR